MRDARGRAPRAALTPWYIQVSEEPKAPPLRYYGGKCEMIHGARRHFPPHLNYLGPTTGSASVLLRKPRSPVETINDIDHNVVTFFRVLRKHPQELIEAIALTPWAREEYNIARNLNTTTGIDDLERARRFIVYSFMSISGATNNTPHTACFRTTKDARTRRKAAPYDLINRDLYTVARRLIGVQIECLDFRDAITRYDNDAAVIYLDPPYPFDTRTNRAHYAHEWSEADHRDAAELLHNAAGMVVVNGSPCDLYRDLYEAHGWMRTDRQAAANSGAKRTESLWLSPRTYAALNRGAIQGSLI